jgi:hypothetical protein
MHGLQVELSAVFVATNFIVRRCTASAIASARTPARHALGFCSYAGRCFSRE